MIVGSTASLLLSTEGGERLMTDLRIVPEKLKRCQAVMTELSHTKGQLVDKNAFSWQGSQDQLALWRTPTIHQGHCHTPTAGRNGTGVQVQALPLGTISVLPVCVSNYDICCITQLKVGVWILLLGSQIWATLGKYMQKLMLTALARYTGIETEEVW